MNKKIFKLICSFALILFAFGTISVSSLAADHTHIFEEGVCSCGTYYMENHEVSKIRLTDKGQRLFTVTWKTSDNAPFVIESDGMLHPIEIKRTASPGTELIRPFKLLDKASIPRGKGAIICMKETLSAVDSDNYIVPIWMI